MWRQDNAFGYEMADDLATTVALFQEISDTKSFALRQGDHLVLMHQQM